MALFDREGAIDTLLIIRAEELINGLTLAELPFPSSLAQMETLLISGRVGEQQRT